MPNVLVSDVYLTNIANAIREKNKSTDTYKPSEMALAISEIKTGGDIILTVTVQVGSVVTITEPDGNTQTAESVEGIATFTVTSAGEYAVSASLNGKVYATETINISPSYHAILFDTLENTSWKHIREASDAGVAPSFWSIGDTKSITIDGTVGATEFSSLTMDAYIIGFNHNSNIEGNNRIHFKLGKMNGVQIALIDSSYNSNTTTSGKFTMNTANINRGGWNASHMRKTVLGSDSTPTSPTANTLLAAIPSDLRAVMKSVIKYSDNTGGGSNTASYVTATTDYLPLLAEYEVFGTRSYANSAEQNFQQQYAYYANGNSKVHYKHNATAANCVVWLRSVRSGYTYSFCYIHTSGSVNYYNAYSSSGVSPAFVV